jgi:hypothetical protein
MHPLERMDACNYSNDIDYVAVQKTTRKRMKDGSTKLYQHCRKPRKTIEYVFETEVQKLQFGKRLETVFKHIGSKSNTQLMITLLDAYTLTDEGSSTTTSRGVPLDILGTRHRVDMMYGGEFVELTEDLPVTIYDRHYILKVNPDTGRLSGYPLNAVLQRDVSTSGMFVFRQVRFNILQLLRVSTVCLEVY